MATKHPEICVTVEASSDDYRLVDHVIKAMRAPASPRQRSKNFAMRRCPARIGNCFGFAAVGSRWCRTEEIFAPFFSSYRVNSM
jgi:hypothetical protein